MLTFFSSSSSSSPYFFRQMYEYSTGQIWKYCFVFYLEFSRHPNSKSFFMMFCVNKISCTTWRKMFVSQQMFILSSSLLVEFVVVHPISGAFKQKVPYSISLVNLCYLWHNEHSCSNGQQIHTPAQLYWQLHLCKQKY